MRVRALPTQALEAVAQGVAALLVLEALRLDLLERLGWERPNAHGSMFVWVKLPGGRTDSMAFCEELMEKAGVIVTPGASFGPHGEGYVRMALVLPPEGLERAVSAIEEAGILG